MLVSHSQQMFLYLLWRICNVLRGDFCLLNWIPIICHGLSDSIVSDVALKQCVISFVGVPWTEEEHRMFLLGLQKLGKGDWRGISRSYVVSRTPTQVASHAQKYFIRQSNASRRKRRSSLFDMAADEVSIFCFFLLIYFFIPSILRRFSLGFVWIKDLIRQRKKEMEKLGDPMAPNLLDCLTILFPCPFASPNPESKHSLRLARKLLLSLAFTHVNSLLFAFIVLW